jgi:ribosomal protein S18 acetylase RimI-like enzyme
MTYNISNTKNSKSMIQKLKNKNLKLAEKIYSVFQVSYSVEAKILKAVDFPPLKRTGDDFIKSETLFYGFHINNELAAVIELEINLESIHIQSLVVDPGYFRRGIAGKLLGFVFDNFSPKLFTVETGLDNLPAVDLYKKFGFSETQQYDTNHGIRKIRFEK